MMPQLVSLQHSSGLCLDLMDIGAAWLSCRVPLSQSHTREVILGCATLADYSKQNAYLGAMIGRVANRIANARFVRNGVTTILSTATPPHQLHGGPVGFDKRIWTIQAQSATHVRFQLVSADGDQGFPGELTVTLDVTLSGPAQITLDITATTTRETPISISQHAYFNLDEVHGDVRQHHLQINAAHFLQVDAALIPLGYLTSLDEAQYYLFDFRHSKMIATHLMCEQLLQRAGSFDHAFLLPQQDRYDCQQAATLTSNDGILSMTLSSTMPALHLYTGQFLEGVKARDGSVYRAFNGVALEPSFLPNSSNHSEWPQPSCWLLPEQIYRHRMRYDFGVHSHL